MQFVRETIGVILIIVFVISIEIITQKITNTSIKIMNQEIEKVEKEEEKIEVAVSKLSETWKNEEAKLSCYMEHDELEEISKLINSLEIFSNNDDKEKMNQNIHEIKFKMEHIKNKQNIKIQNIF